MHTHTLTTNKQKAQKTARQAAGILNKVLEMIDQDSYCPDVIQQVDAVIGLLNSSKRELLSGHLDHCLEHQIKENKDKTIKELIKIYNLKK